MEDKESVVAIESEEREKVTNANEEVTHESDEVTNESEEETNESEEIMYEVEEVTFEDEEITNEGEERIHESEMSISDDQTEIESIMKKEPVEDITISPDIIIKEEYEEEDPSTNNVWVAEGLMEEDEAKYCIPSTSDMNEEKLIKAVKDHPQLYDFSHQNYHDSSVCNNSWEIIGKEIKCSAEECKTKWKSLMEYFCKIVQLTSIKSSQAAKKYKPWHLEGQMEFLRPFLMVQKDQTINFKPLSADNKVEENISKRLSSKLFMQGYGPLKTGTEKKQQNLTPMVDLIFREYLGKKYKPQQDHLAKFFQSMEATVRTLPPLMQVKIKSQISELVHNAEFEAIASHQSVYKSVSSPSRAQPPSYSSVPIIPNSIAEQLLALRSVHPPIISSSSRAPVPPPKYHSGLANPSTIPLRRPSNKHQLLAHL